MVYTTVSPITAVETLTDLAISVGKGVPTVAWELTVAAYWRRWIISEPGFEKYCATFAVLVKVRPPPAFASTCAS